jgi:hypothetical protein
MKAGEEVWQETKLRAEWESALKVGGAENGWRGGYVVARKTLMDFLMMFLVSTPRLVVTKGKLRNWRSSEYFGGWR